MDSHSQMEKRGKALENLFFTKQEEQDIEAYRKKLADKQEMEAIAKASGFENEDVLQALVDLGAKAETLVAISLIPVIKVAWADGTLDDKERDAILSTIKGEGIDESTVSYELVKGWLTSEPSREMYDAWNLYIDGLASSLGEASFKQLGSKVIGMARKVAEASGGILGFGSKVSSSEERVLAELETKFA